MTRRRVAITGIGSVSALGSSCAEFWDAVAAGRSGIGPITLVDSSTLTFKNGAEVRDFDSAVHFPNRSDQTLDRFAQLALVAAREAVADCGLEWDDALRARTGVITGTGGGGQDAMDTAFRRLYAERKDRIHPHSIPRIMANSGASQISMEFGFKGPAFTTSTACSSSNHALGLAYWLVRDGAAEIALAGGSEAPFTLGNLKAWDALRVVSPDTCRPFCKDRLGMVLGEGGAILVLESLDAARARGARIHAEIIGFGMSADAFHLTRPSREGPVAAMRAALNDAAVAVEEVDYVNAHGTGTPGNDPNESAAIREVFGAHADHLAVSSTKSLHGHALGAAGALESVATILALENGLLPPTANFTEPDPECDLDVVPNHAREADLGVAVSNSFAFGGLNAVLVFRRCAETTTGERS